MVTPAWFLRLAARAKALVTELAPAPAQPPPPCSCAHHAPTGKHRIIRLVRK